MTFVCLHLLFVYINRLPPIPPSIPSPTFPTPSSSPTASSSTSPFSSTKSGLSPALLAPLAFFSVPCSATFALPPMLPRLLRLPLFDPGEVDGVVPLSKSNKTARRSSSSIVADPRKEVEAREGGGGEGTEKGRLRKEGEGEE